MPKKTKIRLGFPGHYKEAEVSLPETEPVPWDPEADLKVVGKRVPRVEGPDKVTGQARYTFDLQMPGMLHGAILRCPLPHARLKKIDTSKAEAHPAVRAVLVLEEQEYPYAGFEVAAVAALTQDAAEEALRLIKVDYEPLPFVTDPEEARKPGAVKVRSKGNVEATTRESEGEVEAAFRSADAVAEGTWRTPVALHACMEGHGSLAKWDGDHLTLWDSTQAVFEVRESLAKALGIPEDKVRVIVEHTGGGFGSKLQMRSYSPIAARLAKKAGAPVRLLFSRGEDFLVTGNRPSSVQTVKIAGKRDGTLTAVSWKTYGTAGVGGGADTSGPLSGLYRFPARKVEEEDVFTHAGPGCPMRAPGHVQGVVALEGALDDWCGKVGLDPLEVRIKNDPSEVRREEFRIGAKKIGWRPRPTGSDAGPLKRGMGVAGSTWDGSGVPGPRAEVKLHADGSAEIAIGTQDLGTGTHTILAQVAAEELGLKAQEVAVHLGDSTYPYSILSGGSLTAGTVTPVARSAAAAAKRALFDLAAPMLGAPASELETSGRRIRSRAGKKEMTWEEVLRKVPGGTLAASGERIPNFARFQPGTAGCQFAEAEVDTETGKVRITRVVAVHDSGRVVNPLLWENQVRGGIVQGISFALLEQRVMDHRFGKVLNASLEGYKVLGALEVPEIEVIYFPVGAGINNTQVAGIGEPGIIPTAAAVANAVANALGFRIYELPITPARVLDALEAFRAKKGNG